LNLLKLIKHRLVAFKNGRQIKISTLQIIKMLMPRLLLKKAAEQDICIPIGEGENCW
jgi:hypothetical protein